MFAVRCGHTFHGACVQNSDVVNPGSAPPVPVMVYMSVLMPYTRIIKNYNISLIKKSWWTVTNRVRNQTTNPGHSGHCITGLE
jgi:hypothetical protein